MRRYKISVKEEDGSRRFTRKSRRSVTQEIALLWDEHENAKQIAVEYVEVEK